MRCLDKVSPLFYYLKINKAKTIASVIPTKSANNALTNVCLHLVTFTEEKYNAIT